MHRRRGLFSLARLQPLGIVEEFKIRCLKEVLSREVQEEDRSMFDEWKDIFSAGLLLLHCERRAGEDNAESSANEVTLSFCRCECEISCSVFDLSTLTCWK